jgi:hypothetical protein
MIPDHCKRVRLIGTDKYSSIIEFKCNKSFIRWDSDKRIVRVLNCKLEFLE